MSDDNNYYTDPITGEKTPKTFADKLIDNPEDFQPDAMEDYDDRVASGEFADLTKEQIVDIYRKEAIDQEIADDEERVNQRIREMDEQEGY